MNKLYKKILIATDGSELTEKAITHAIELAKTEGLDVTKWIMEGQPAKDILKLSEEPLSEIETLEIFEFLL